MDLWEIQESLGRRPIILETVLTLDSMFLQIARNFLARAAQLQSQVDTAHGECQDLIEKVKVVLEAHHGDSHKAYDQLEQIYVQQEGANATLAYAYAPVIEALSETHIFCAAALESHVNSRSAAVFSGKIFDKFDRLDLEGKWLMLPRLLGRQGFEPGAEPFQSFAQLVSFRNGLVLS